MVHYVWTYVLVSDNHRCHSVGTARDLAAAFERMAFRSNPDFPRKLVAVYRTELLPLEYEERGAQHPRALEAEDRITLQMMKREGGNWFRVMSHNFQHQERDEVPDKLLETEFPTLCYCGVPAERRIGKTGMAYYTCPRKNRDWLERMAFPEFIHNVANRACRFYAHADFYERLRK